MGEQRIRWIYKDGEASEIPAWAYYYDVISTKNLKMNTRQQQAAIKAQQKAQKDLADQAFKQECRRTSIQIATSIEKGQIPEDVIAAAEKIYQWLIKVLK